MDEDDLTFEEADAISDDIQKALSDIDVESVEFHDTDDPEEIEIVISGRFKKDAFTKGIQQKQTRSGDPFDSAKPF